MSCHLQRGHSAAESTTIHLTQSLSSSRTLHSSSFYILQLIEEQFFIIVTIYVLSIFMWNLACEWFPCQNVNKATRQKILQSHSWFHLLSEKIWKHKFLTYKRHTNVSSCLTSGNLKRCMSFIRCFTAFELSKQEILKVC